MKTKNPAAVALGKLGGKAGTGAAKARTTSFTSDSAKAALAARWAKTKRKPKRAARLPNAALCQPAERDVERKTNTEL